MGTTPLEHYDPALGRIVRILYEAIERYDADNTKTSAESKSLLTREISQRLETYFELPNNKEKLITMATLATFQTSIFDQLEKLQQQNKSHLNTEKFTKQKSYQKKLFSSLLLQVAGKYMLLKNLKKHALAKLRQKRLQYILKRWKLLKRIKQEELELQLADQEDSSHKKATTELKKELDAFEKEMKFLFGSLVDPLEYYRLDPFTPEDIQEAIDHSEKLGDDIHEHLTQLQADLGIDKHLSEEDRQAFKQEIDSFKKNLFDVNTTLAKTPAELEKVSHKFETQILGKLDHWKEKVKMRLSASPDTAHSAHSDITHHKIESRFAKMYQGLSRWARGESHQSLNQSAENQPAENQLGANQLADNAEPNAALARNSIEAIRREAQQAVLAARAKFAREGGLPAKGSFALFKAHAQKKPKFAPRKSPETENQAQAETNVEATAEANRENALDPNALANASANTNPTMDLESQVSADADLKTDSESPKSSKSKIFAIPKPSDLPSPPTPK